jgi:serine/threonine-protein kinase
MTEARSANAPPAAAVECLGRYQILGKLGQGAMGVVYKARDPLIERIVAIKTVNLAGLSRDEADSYEQRFYREAKSAGRLNHPNIVTIHDVGRSDGLAYIAMEFLEGRSLRQILDSGVVLAPGKVVKIAYQIAKGLAFAHKNGVVHRDVKPANIVVLRNGTVKIMDFGVALLPTGSLTMAGTAFGSPKYMSPEQVVGRPVDGRSDIFSLGAVLYELLTGVPPFQGEDLNAILYQVINDMPPAPSSRNPEVSAALDAVVLKAMAKQPDERHQNARDLAKDLCNVRDMAAAKLPARPGRTPQRWHIRRPAGEATVKVEVIPAPAAEGQASPATGAVFRQRRSVFIYGGLAALLALAAGWGLLRPGARGPAMPAPAAVAPVDAVRPAAALAPALPAAAAEERTAAAPSPPTAPPPAGRILLAVAPWGEVYVDGRKRGVTPPLKQLRLPPGRHVIEIRNGDFPEHRQTVDLAPDASVKIKHRFK